MEFIAIINDTYTKCTSYENKSRRYFYMREQERRGNECYAQCCLIDDIFFCLLLCIWIYLNRFMFEYHQPVEMSLMGNNFSLRYINSLSFLCFGELTKRKRRIVFRLIVIFLHFRRSISFIILEKFSFLHFHVF